MQSSLGNKEGVYFPALTGVRALAAYMVFVHHFIPTEYRNEHFNLGYIFGEMHIGVTFFFVLSGFLIHNRYGSISTWSWLNFKNYVVARIARIYPLFFVLNFLTFLLIMLDGEVPLFKSFLSFLLNASLLKGFFYGSHFSGIRQSWSLTVEFCFYFSAPFLFYKIKNVLIYPRVSFFLMLFGFGMVLIFSDLPLFGFFRDNRFMLSYTFFGRSFEFFAGCFLSSMLQDWKGTRENGGFWTYVGFVLILVALLSLVSFRRPQNYGVHTFPGLLVNNFFLPVAIVLFFRGLIFENTIFRRLLSSRLFQLLGKSSYAFYLIHHGFIQEPLSKVFHNQLVVFVLILLISIGLYYLIEEPLNKFTRSRFITRSRSEG